MPELIPFETVEGRCETEFVEKKSRFLSFLAHAETEEEAQSFLAEIRALHPAATHWVTAWVLRSNNTLRFNDDGEPSGTAGKPALEVLVHEGLTDTALVVVRYFGGTLLGAGGLVRAYARAAKEAAAAAVRVRMAPCTRFSLTVGYAAWPRVSRTLAELSAREEALCYGEAVTYRGTVAEGDYSALCDSLRELTAGSVAPERIETVIGKT